MSVDSIQDKTWLDPTRSSWNRKSGQPSKSPSSVHLSEEVRGENQQLVEQVRRFCDTESFGTEFQADGMSSETRRAVMKLESELETRLMSLKNRFSRNPEYEEFYRAAMEKNKEGYARRVPSEEVAERPTKYLLPHFEVPKVCWAAQITFSVRCSQQCLQILEL